MRPAQAGGTATPEPQARTEPVPRAPRASRVNWLRLSASANALLFAVTNVLTLDAPIPLLWILSLSLYLLHALAH